MKWASGNKVTIYKGLDRK